MEFRGRIRAISSIGHAALTALIQDVCGVRAVLVDQGLGGDVVLHRRRVLSSVHHSRVATDEHRDANSHSPAPTPSTTDATEASPFKRLTGYFSGKAPEPTTPKAPVEPCNCLVALRLGIFFVLYPAVISYLWFYYIPTRSIPK